jgi:hypothetical protein
MKNNKKIALIAGVLLSSNVISSVAGRVTTPALSRAKAQLKNQILEAVGLKETQAERNARIYSEQYSAQIAAGKPATYAKAYANQIVANIQPAYAADYANQISLGKSEVYANTYANLKYQKKYSDDFVEKYAEAYSSKIAAGESTAYAEIYANQIASGRTIAFATGYTDKITTGKSTAYAEMYATIRDNGGSDDYATKYSTLYAVEIATGKTTKYATNYAYQITLGKSEVYAKNYAEQIAVGKTEKYAADYAAQIDAGKTTKYATNYAEQIAVGKTEKYAADYAAQIDAGKTEEYATKHATLVEGGQSTEYATAYLNQLGQGKSEEYARNFAKAIAEGKPNVYASSFATQIQSGKTEEYAKEYAEIVAEQVINKKKSYDGAGLFAEKYIEGKKLLKNAKSDQTDAETLITKLEKDAECYKDLFSWACKPDDGVSELIAAGVVISVGTVGLVYANSGSTPPVGGGTATNIDNFNYDQYYVYHPVAAAEKPGDEEQDIVGLDNLSYLRDVFHASDNLDHMGEYTNEAHSLEERGHLFKQAEIVTKNGKKTYNMTFVDAIGMNATTPQTTYLNSTVKVSGLYLQHTNLDVRANTTLTADVVNVKNETLAVNGTVSVGSFLLAADASLTGGNNIAFNASSSKQIVDYMKDNLPGRYAGAEYGKFDLRGTVDNFTAKKGMNVYLPTMSLTDPFTTTAPRITTLNHDGGAIVLSGLVHTRVKDYKVSSASVIKVKWDNWSSNIYTPLMTVTGTCDIGTNKLGIMFDSIPSFMIVKGAKLTILFAPNGTMSGKRDGYNQDLAGGSFEFKTEALLNATTSNALTVTCTKATTSVAAATGLSASLSADILGKSDSLVKGRFAVLEIPDAVTALDAAVSDRYLSDVAVAPLSYFSIHEQAQTVGGWSFVDESSESILTSMGVNAGAAKVGISVSTPSVQTPAAAPTVGAHVFNNGVFMDAFYTGDTQTFGSKFGYQKGMLSMGVSYMYDQRQGVSDDNSMGRIEANNVNQHRILLNAGLNKRIESIDFSATAFAEALRAAQGYDLLINDEKFHINGHSFDRHCGLQLQAKANLAAGFISGAFGLSGSTSKIEPTTSVSFSLSY